MLGQHFRLMATLILCIGLTMAACTSSDGKTTTSTVGDLTVNEPVKAGTLAKDFPPEVPLIEGQIGESYALENADVTTWTVDIAVTDAETSFNEGMAALENAGFTKGFSSFDNESGGASIWENENYSVIFNVSQNDSGDTVAG